MKSFILNTIISSKIIPMKLRMVLYKLVGLTSNKIEIRPNCYFQSVKSIEIGNGSFINYSSQFHATPRSKIIIGENCFIGMNVTFFTITHDIGDEKKRAGNNVYKSIEIENGCWIGANSIILPGVKIGSGCIIDAGSVVNKDCAPNALYGGNPAKKIKDL